ncbi:MAG: radical SAM protein [Planctomycetes bacterium]|nr:radical SAM protein [Planctomycetota bacterium]
MSSDKTHIFGPVPSRRLGRSLGVDLVPFKRCTFDCIYCQLGRTTNLTMERFPFVSPQAIHDELAKRLINDNYLDFITLSGSGEPTLCKDLGRIISGIKELTDIPVAVLTNGSLLWDKTVRQELMNADLVVPSLDAGSARLCQYINRPCAGFDFEKYVEGLIAFRREFNKPVWVEVFMLFGINSIRADVKEMADIIAKIAPDKVQLNTVARPPAEDFAMSVPENQMRKLAEIFSCPVEIISNQGEIHRGISVVATCDDVLSLLHRRPCTINDIASGIGIHVNEASKYIGELIREGKISSHVVDGKSYYQARQESIV